MPGHTRPSSPTSPSRSPAKQRRAAPHAAAAEGVEVADRKSSIVDVVTAADREVEALIRARIAEARPDDALPRRGVRRRHRRLGHHLGRRPDRRHRQLPVRQRRVRREHRRRPRRTRPDDVGAHRGRRRGPGHRATVFRAAAGQGRPVTASRCPSPRPARSPRRSSPPASGTRPTGAGSRSRCSPDSSARCGTSAAGERRRSTAARSERAWSTPTTSAGSTRGTWPAGRSSRRRPARSVRIWEAGGTRSFLFASPAVADELEALVRGLEAGALGAVQA